MATQTPPTPAAALLREADARMAQALENFFQRSRAAIQDRVLRAIETQMTSEFLARGQTCLEWLNAYPDALSETFAAQFRLHLSRAGDAVPSAMPPAGELALVDDRLFVRQLAVEKLGARLAERLRAERLLLHSRLASLHKPGDGAGRVEDHSPLAVAQALSRALDQLDIDTESGTLLLQSLEAPLQDTLRQTYNAINQYLGEQGVVEAAAALPVARPLPRRAAPDVADPGRGLLEHIRAAAAMAPAAAVATAASRSPGAAAAAGFAPAAYAAGTPALAANFHETLRDWQARSPEFVQPDSDTAPVLVLRQLQQHASHTDADAFDLAMLDVVAGLFECILDDPDISPRYQTAIAHLQIPALRAALDAPDFFDDPDHPARRLIDLLGQLARRYPENAPAHASALSEVQAACTAVADERGQPAAAFARACDTLERWQAQENAQSEAALAGEVARLALIERQELGILLALENLNDLSERYPAPESVLRRLEAAWVPYMAAHYVDEAGEGPAWRAAGLTLQQLFVSLRAPSGAEARESMLRSIPDINAALRRGLLAQGADAAQLRDFFGAITATQECWVRPDSARPEPAVSRASALSASSRDIEALVRQNAGAAGPDPALQAAQALLEGDWVDFDPPRDGLATARVAWVGVHGYLLFCDSDGEQRFSLDCERLAAEIRAGRARIPEQSLTRKAMLRLHERMTADAG